MHLCISAVIALEVVMMTVTVRGPVAIETVAGKGTATAAPAPATESVTEAGSGGDSSNSLIRHPMTSQ